MHKLKEKLKEQLQEFEDRVKKMPSGRLSASDVETIHKLSDTIKNLCKIEMYEEYGEGDSYEDESSYRRGRMNARRDSRGRYSREGEYSEDRGNSNRGTGSYSYNSSNASKEEMLERLEEMRHEIELM